MKQVDYLIDRALSLSRIDLTSGDLTWVAKNIENPQLEFTGETTEKRDAQGTLIAQFDTAKGATLSGELSLLNMMVLASQLGTEVQFGESASITVDYVDEMVAEKAEGETQYKCKTKYLPKTTPTAIYALNADGGMGTKYTIGTAEGNATYAQGTGDDANIGIITLPAAVTAGGKFVVAYKYDSATAVMVEDNAEEFAVPAKYILKILGADVCNPALKRSGAIVFPKAKLDNNFSLNLTTDGTHPFSLTALKDYCDEAGKLCYVVWDE